MKFLICICIQVVVALGVPLLQLANRDGDVIDFENTSPRLARNAEDAIRLRKKRESECNIPGYITLACDLSEAISRPIVDSIVPNIDLGFDVEGLDTSVLRFATPPPNLLSSLMENIPNGKSSGSSSGGGRSGPGRGRPGPSRPGPGRRGGEESRRGPSRPSSRRSDCDLDIEIPEALCLAAHRNYQQLQRALKSAPEEEKEELLAPDMPTPYDDPCMGPKFRSDMLYWRCVLDSRGPGSPQADLGVIRALAGVNPRGPGSLASDLAVIRALAGVDPRTGKPKRRTRKGRKRNTR